MRCLAEDRCDREYDNVVIVRDVKFRVPALICRFDLSQHETPTQCSKGRTCEERLAGAGEA